ncbi:TlpA family protein disulfide reductase [Halomonas sp. ANAO-440]|uniref:TlpA disulfide reductase family protein n=1 Tax=Halomonas sp. ANAO-440 TaxID=2861360 RepID=UPI001CAA62F7|nr:TlpA disulfide reductase family protein [Halomonas sp. ANAO-440]MBZ0332135.1 TlpA family protein disulfide reductase [Halomonas sp. ANAO-440]
MDAFALGPVLISVPRLYAIGCALLLLLAAWLLLGLTTGTRVRWFNGLILAWLVGARLGYVAMNLDAYAAAPLDVLKLWQPGFHGIWGLLAALIWTAWSLREHLLSMIGAMALTIGTSALWLVLVTLAPLGGDMGIRELPHVTLENLDGEPVNLQSLRGERVVVNLWATWCPPCLREMPLLAEADTREGVTVVVINQGEELLQVVRYLDEQALAFRYPLLDPGQVMMRTMESPGLPTTVLFNPEGRAVERHVGELSRAQLDNWLSRH